MKKNKITIISFILLLTLIIYLEPQLFKEYNFIFAEPIDKIYKVLKIVSAVAIFIIYFFRKIKPSKILYYVTGLQLFMFLSTIINGGDIVRFFGPALTTIVMTMLAEILISEQLLYSTLKKVNYYLRICFILNLISIILIDFTTFKNFTNIYFLGIDNRFVFTFIPWIVFEGIISIYENKKLNKTWFIFVILCEIILLYKSSAAAMIVMAVFPIIYIFENNIDKISKLKNTTIISYIMLNLGLVVFKVQNIFSIIIKAIGKDLTLSGRTYIWEGILNLSKQKLLLGNGMQSIAFDKNFFYESSVPYFLNHCKVIHGHNSIMTILYRGGVIAVTIYLLILNEVLKQLKKCKNSKYRNLLYVSIFITLILSLFDTMDYACIYFIFTICINSNKLIVKEKTISKEPTKLQEFIRKCIRRIKKIIFMNLFNLFPIDNNKILISNYVGKGYGDSAKYIVESIKEKKYKIKWIVNSDNVKLPEYVKAVKKDSIKYFYDISTSKIWINNCRPTLDLKKRKEQFYIQTWHGGLALKKIEGDAEDKLPKRYINRGRRDSKMTDLMVSNSAFCTEMYKNAFWYNGKILEVGTPRNDILFDYQQHNNIREKVCNELKISKNYNLMLYAPTFRNDKNLDCYNIDFNKLIINLKKNTKKEWKILVRLHPNISSISDKLNVFNENVINVTNYPDNYELMVSSDMLITDYSSVMFEFSFMKKPVFLYATDIENYLDERGLYFDYYKLPYCVSKNNDELMKNILEFDNEKYQKNLNNFMKKIKLNETGKAAELVAQEIIKVIEGDCDE